MPSHLRFQSWNRYQPKLCLELKLLPPMSCKSHQISFQKVHHLNADTSKLPVVPVVIDGGWKSVLVTHSIWKVGVNCTVVPANEDTFQTKSTTVRSPVLTTNSVLLLAVMIVLFSRQPPPLGSINTNESSCYHQKMECHLTKDTWHCIIILRVDC
jgi:hypothetical protein